MFSVFPLLGGDVEVPVTYQTELGIRASITLCYLVE